METHKRIYNKLADKVELASERIELSITNEMKKNRASFDRSQKKLVSYFADIRNLSMKINQEVMQLEKISKLAQKHEQEINQLAKDLGIKPDSIEGYDMNGNIADGAAANAYKTRNKKIVSAL